MGKWSSNLVSAITVSNKNPHALYELIASLKRQGYAAIETIVVLNGYSLEQKEKLEKTFPTVQVIHNRENLFYCKANNQGIRIARGEFVLCLNDDLKLEESFVQEMVRAARKDRYIGMVAGCILRPDAETVDTTGLFLGRSRRPVERGYGRRRRECFKEEGYVFGAGGVAALYRRQMLEEVKLNGQYFDEDYDMFYEDLDIAWRAQKLGWRGYYTPCALAYHQRGLSAKQVKPRFAFLRRYYFTYLPPELKVRLLKNRYMTIVKNDRVLDLLWRLPWVLAYELKIWSYLFLFEPEVALRFLKERGFIKSAWQRRRQILAQVQKYS